MAIFLLFSLVLFSLSSFALPPPQTISNAVEILSNSGYLSMALTLQLTANSLNLESPTLTIFTPSDVAFARSGQLSFPELQYHISPMRLTIESLKILPHGATIPTLCFNHSLIITDSSDSDGNLLINDVLIQESAIFDDGYVIIFGIDEFFSYSFQISSTHLNSPNPAPEPSSDLPASLPPGPSENDTSQHESSGLDVDNLFSQASSLLISRGYTIMGTFLDLQLGGFLNQTRLTVFAPVDEAIATNVKNFSDYSQIFRGHVVPRLFSWKDLARVENGATLPTASRGFMINVTWSGDILLLNGVPVIFPDMYESNSLAVHGINRLFISQEKQAMGESFSELGDGEDYGNYTPDFGDYGAP